MKKLFYSFLFLLTTGPIFSQLSSGDIAFIEWNADSPYDMFRFVCLNDIQAGTTIYFSDNEPSNGSFNSGEGNLILSFNETVSCGNIITITHTNQSAPNVISTSSLSAATCSRSGNFFQSVGGDGLWAYIGSLGVPLEFIAAFGNDGSVGFGTSTEGLISSTGLTDGLNAVAPIERDNYCYNGVLTSGTKSQLLSAINNYSYWLGSNTTHQNFSGTFTVTGCSGPQTITWNGSSDNSWSTPSNWSTNSVPTSSDNVIIPSAGVTNTLMYWGNVSCANLSIEGSSSTRILSFGSSNKITCTGLTIDNNGTYGLFISAGEIEVNGTFTWKGRVEIQSNGVIDVNGDINLAGTLVENFTGGNIYCSGDFDASAANNFTPTGGTLNFDGPTASSIDLHSSANIYNLVINKNTASHDLNLNDDLDINGDLTITSGDIDGDDDDYGIYLAGDLTCSTSSSELYDLEFFILDGSQNSTLTALTAYSLDLEINKSNTASVTPLSGQVYFDGITINGGKLVVNSGVTVKTDNNYGYVINSGGEIEVQGGLLWNTANYSRSFYINGGVLDVNGGEVRIGDLAYDTDAELDMVNGTIDLSGGTINICAELDVANGTINISGGFLNIGAYTGTSTNYGTAGEHTFDMDAGNLNLTGGIVTILRQYNNSTTEIIDIPSSVVVNATSSNTIVLGRGAGTTENFYIDLYLQNNERLGSILIDAGNYNGILKRNLFLNGDLTILTGQFEGDDEEDITLKGSIFTSSTNPLTGYWEDLNFDGINATFGSFSDDDIDININSGNVTANGNISVDRIVVYSGATFNVGSSSFFADNLVNIDGTLMIGSGSFSTTGTSDIDGSLIIDQGFYDANSTFDATSGIINFTDNGSVKVASSVTSFGTLSISEGTVIYDGVNQTLKNDSYHNLQISNSGIKTVTSANTIYGNLIIDNGSTLTCSSSSSDLTLSGGSFNNNGGVLNLGSADLKFTGGNNVTCGAISSNYTGNLIIEKSSSSNIVTTTGNMSLHRVLFKEGVLLVDGDTITTDYSNIIYIGGTLNVTSGLFYSNYAGFLYVYGGTLDIDGGEVRVGNPASHSSSDVYAPSSSTYASSLVDISGGSLNICDEFDFRRGTFNMTGGSMNVFCQTTSSNGSSADKFYMQYGDLNLSGGAITFHGESTSSVSYDAMYLAPSVNSNITSGNMIVFTVDNNGYDENMSIDLNGHNLGSVLVNMGNYELRIDDDQTFINLTLNSGTINTTPYNKVLTIGTSTNETGFFQHNVGVFKGKLKRWFSGTNTGNNSGLFPLYDSGNNKRHIKVEYQQPTDGGTLMAEWISTSMGNNYTLNPISTSCNGSFPIYTTCSEGYWSMTPGNGITNNESKNYNITMNVEGVLSFTNDCHLSAVKRTGGGEWQISGNHLSNTGDQYNPNVTINNASGWSNWGLVGGTGSALPVELSSFGANCNENGVLIHWTTDSEFNSLDFIIEKSEDAITWSYLSSVDANGHSNQKLSYSYLDDSRENSSYYRLIQRDIDGSETIYDPTYISCVSNNNNYSVKTFPNPSKSSFNITLDSKDLSGNAYLHIANLKGKNVYTKNINVMSGVNNLLIDSNFEKGVYLISIQFQDEILRCKHVVN